MWIVILKHLAMLKQLGSVMLSFHTWLTILIKFSKDQSTVLAVTIQGVCSIYWFHWHLICRLLQTDCVTTMATMLSRLSST